MDSHPADWTTATVPKPAQPPLRPKLRLRTGLYAIGMSGAHTSCVIVSLLAQLNWPADFDWMHPTPALLVLAVLTLSWYGFIIHAGVRCARVLAIYETRLPAGRSLYPFVLRLIPSLLVWGGHVFLRPRDQVNYFTLLWWALPFFAAATQVAFVIAGAFCDAEREPEPSRLNTTLLAVAHHAGGFLGITLARRTFPSSNVLKKFKPEFPIILRVLIGIALAVTVLSLFFQKSPVSPLHPQPLTEHTPDTTPTVRVRVPMFQTPLGWVEQE